VKRTPGQLRIIGGQWRSRLIDFDAAHGVRPTPDRVRQTLFDWLAPLIDGARCVDLYAGSGALGFEALSRGAASVDFVERGAPQAAAIRHALGKLGAQDRGNVIEASALDILGAPTAARPYNIAFIDPPYAAGLMIPTLLALRPHLSPVHRIYIEWPLETEPEWPKDLKRLKQKAAGRVSYALAEFDGVAE